MKHQRRAILVGCSGRIRGGSHPCQDAANVRVNDPLAVGIEELKGFFSRVPGEGATKGMKKEKERARRFSRVNK